MKSKAVLVLILLGFKLNNAKIQVFPGTTFEDCSDGKKAQHIDFSGLEYDYVNDTDYYLRGEMRFPGGMKSPVKYEVYIEKFERGQWNVAIINRKGDDFCKVHQSPSEPWYGFFMKFKKKDCPYPPGHVEIFDGEKIAGNPEFIPYTLIGQYRVTLKFMFPKNKDSGFDTDCHRLLVEVMDA